MLYIMLCKHIFKSCKKCHEILVFVKLSIGPPISGIYFGEHQPANTPHYRPLTPPPPHHRGPSAEGRATQPQLEERLFLAVAQLQCLVVNHPEAKRCASSPTHTHTHTHICRCSPSLQGWLLSRESPGTHSWEPSSRCAVGDLRLCFPLGNLPRGVAFGRPAQKNKCCWNPIAAHDTSHLWFERWYKTIPAPCLLPSSSRVGTGQGHLFGDPETPGPLARQGGGSQAQLKVGPAGPKRKYVLGHARCLFDKLGGLGTRKQK